MRRWTLILATIAVVIAISAGARAEELSCPPGYAPDQNNNGCVPSRPSVGPAQGGVAGQAQQLLIAQDGVGGDAKNGPCGFGEYPPCKVVENACALLTANDVAEVLGGSWTRKGSGPMRPAPGAQLINVCAYSGPAEDDDLELTVRDGGRARFDKAVYNLGRGPRKLSGVGDAAYELVSSGPNENGTATAQVELWVIKGDTYFEMMVTRDSPNLALSGPAVALARKVADRAK